MATALARKRGRWPALGAALVEHVPWQMVAGALPGALLALSSLGSAGVLATVLGVVGGVLLAALALLRRGGGALEGNFLGLVSGPVAAADPEQPALTDWLSDLLERLAGLEGRERPLTFGDLWGDDPAAPLVELAMMTTNVTWGRPFRLPFDDDTWQDSLLVAMPGHRERTVHVSLDPASEGGLNLDMTAETIRKLAARGRLAAQQLAAHYGADPPPEARTTWNNHRWVRYRSALASLEALLADFLRAHETGETPSYEDLVATTDPEALPSYPWATEQQRQQAAWLSGELFNLARAVRSGNGAPPLTERAPKPQPVLRNRPDV